eukprot:SAG31_NODE_1395_length_8516_cov_4.162885_3_plen_76_part_00
MEGCEGHGGTLPNSLDDGSVCINFVLLNAYVIQSYGCRYELVDNSIRCTDAGISVLTKLRILMRSVLEHHVVRGP